MKNNSFVPSIKLAIQFVSLWRFTVKIIKYTDVFFPYTNLSPFGNNEFSWETNLNLCISTSVSHLHLHLP